MKESTKGKLHRTEHDMFASLVRVAKSMMSLSNDIESIADGKFMDGIYDDELLSIVYALRENVTQGLAPKIGTMAIEMQPYQI